MRAFMHWVNEYDESIQTRVALFLCLTYKLFGRYSDFFVFFLSTKLEQIYPFWFLPNIRGLIRCEKELFVFWTQNHYKLRGMNSQIWTDIFFFTQIQSFSNLEWINAVDRWCDLSEFCLLYKSHQNLQFVFLLPKLQICDSPWSHCCAAAGDSNQFLLFPTSAINPTIQSTYVLDKTRSYYHLYVITLPTQWAMAWIR